MTKKDNQDNEMNYLRKALEAVTDQRNTLIAEIERLKKVLKKKKIDE